MGLRYFPNISQAVRKRLRQLVYTVFLGNNRAWFHFWGKENLVKQQKVLKYYENDCLQIFFLLFMSVLTVPIVKNVTFRLELTLSF